MFSTDSKTPELQQFLSQELDLKALLEVGVTMRAKCAQGLFSNILMRFKTQGLVAQWITRLPTEQKIPGSSPGKVAVFEL